MFYFFCLLIFEVLFLKYLFYSDVLFEWLWQIYYCYVIKFDVLESWLILNIWLEMRKYWQVDFRMKNLCGINNVIYKFR